MTHTFPSYFPDTLYDVKNTSLNATHRLTELTIISLCLSTAIITLSIFASRDMECYFFAMLASAITIIHNVATLFFRSTRVRRRKAVVSGIELPETSSPPTNKFMVNSILLFMIPLWLVAIGWMIASLYFMGLQIWERWQWGPLVMLSWPLKFTLIGLEIAVLCSMGSWGVEESREAEDSLGGHEVEIKWCDGGDFLVIV
jgi:hypothetical protein